MLEAAFVLVHALKISRMHSYFTLHCLLENKCSGPPHGIPQ